MVLKTSVPVSWDWFQSVIDANSKPISYFTTALLLLILWYSQIGPKPNAPLINPKRATELSESRSRNRFVFGARSLIGNWFKANPKKTATVIGDMGLMTVLPPSMANEVRSDARLSFSAFSTKFFHTHIPGFQAFLEHNVESAAMIVINKNLTKLLAKITQPLAEETMLALETGLSKEKEWRTIDFQPTIQRIVAQISSRVFLGEELCRSEAWLKITSDYATTGFLAADALRAWPEALRPIVHWFMPLCQKLRAQLKEASSIINPVIELRQALKAEARARGQREPEYNDAIEWFEQGAKGGATFDPAIAQLFLATVAIHTTTDLLCQTMIQIARNPEYFELLRAEIMDVLKEEGWQKTSLQKMQLLDSAVKESQRLKPLQVASMERVALEDITLSDGTFIPKGSVSIVSSHALWDPEVYDSPEKWDGARFLRLRQVQGMENLAQLVSTSQNHLGFGHGKHACPGRFFAANEIKIALAHLLLQYQWRLPEGERASVSDYGVTPVMDPGVKMEMRRRADDFIPVVGE